MESPFPAPIVIPPKQDGPHTSTIIFLHGRGQTAALFHAPFLCDTPIPDHPAASPSLREALPTTKFVFPTAPLSRASKYRRSVIRQWYDGSGDWEPEALGGMHGSVEHVHSLVRAEVSILNGDASRVVLGGYSQGCAMALTSLLLWGGASLGGAVGLSGFIPLNACMTSILDDEGGDGSDDVVFASDSDDGNGDDPLRQAVRALREEAELPESESPLSFLRTPVFIGHGTEDCTVDVYHARMSAALLEKMGLAVRLSVYEGLGHGYSSIELGDMVSFLKQSRCV
ncbi:putative esterase [Geosmithia morbida]|uniref:Esterase n=1 Tax=Geosmithia morbida TaxID=1094350 RepID=A0A9P4YUV1_9HYPO|nr:putative esterase [Geosmithia morbida]KAF4122113.1 putative esterase [Geosmithia morbida]